MLKKKMFYFLLLTAFLLLAGCSENSSNAILDHVPNNTKENAGHQDRQLEKVEWEGEWTRNLLHNTGILNITNATNEDFTFEMNVAGGGNAGTIEGVAQISNKSALFAMDDSTCEINFKWHADAINVAVTEECQRWGGYGTFFHGDFQKGQIENEPDLATQGILTKKENQLFQSVVGMDYPLFLENIMIVYEGDDIDGLETKVISGEVRGMAASMKAIIMINDQFVYAAVPSDEGFSLFYYTNNKKYSKSLPLTIQNWIEGGQEFQNIIFK